MPVIDSRIGIIVADGKPDRVCEWPRCPLTEYSGQKMKVCSRCTSVRYCSKNCQRQDWMYHRTICHIPPIMDMGGWIRAYEWLFKWAAIEAFQVHTDDWKILTDILLVAVTTRRGDRLGGPMPSPFIILSARVITPTELDALAKGCGMTKAASMNYDESLDIRENGGMGQALVAFMCLPLSSSPTAPYIWMFERYPLYDKPIGPYSGYTHMVQWEGVLKGVANGDISVSELSQMVNSPLSDTESAAELLSNFEAMDI